MESITGYFIKISREGLEINHPSLIEYCILLVIAVVIMSFLIERVLIAILKTSKK